MAKFLKRLCMWKDRDGVNVSHLLSCVCSHQVLLCGSWLPHSLNSPSLEHTALLAPPLASHWLPEARRGSSGLNSSVLVSKLFISWLQINSLLRLAHVMLCNSKEVCCCARTIQIPVLNVWMTPLTSELNRKNIIWNMFDMNCMKMDECRRFNEFSRCVREH